MADDPDNNEITHTLLSRVIDLWIPEKPIPDKTDLMNYLVMSINRWLAWKYGPPPFEPFEYDGRPYPTKRPECLKGGQLDTRIWNAMVNDAHPTLEEMASHSDMELLRLPNFGLKSLKRLRELAGNGQVETLD